MTKRYQPTMVFLTDYGPKEKGTSITSSGGRGAPLIQSCTELPTPNVHQGWMSKHVGGVPADRKQGTWTDQANIQ